MLRSLQAPASGAVNVHSRQIARYESEDYQNVSWDTLLKIPERPDVKIEGKMALNRKVA